MILAIIGSRNFTDYEFFRSTLNNLIEEKGWDVTEIVSGGAIGADTLGWQYAIVNKIKMIEFKPEWDKFGKAAGMIRNTSIIDYCDVVVAFQKNKSKGTQDSINKAIKAGKETIVVNCDYH